MEDNNEKGVASKIADHLKENTAMVNEGGKRKFEAQKQSFKERHAAATAPSPPFKEKLEQEKEKFEKRHAEATAPDPGLEKVKDAKGIKAKINQIGSNIADSARENTEKERQRRAQILHNSNPKT